MEAAVRQELNRIVLCWLATVAPDGTPNVSPKEIFAWPDGSDFLIAEIASPGSLRNIRNHPAVCVSFIDIFRQCGFKLIGRARVIDPEDADFAACAAPLTARGGPDFPVRHVLSVTPERIERIWAPSFHLLPERTDEDRIRGAFAAYGVVPAD